MNCNVKKLLIKNSEEVLVDISFEIKKSLALVGQSGSGKSLTLKAFLGLLPKTLTSELEIEIDFDPKNIAYVAQNPFTALSPMTKIKDQFFLPKDEALIYLKMTGLDGEILDRFPPQLSGGQLQRVIISMALSVEPKLILFDEPTTALDQKNKKDLLELLKDLSCKKDFLTLYVTHDLDDIDLVCDDIAILNNGKIVEFGTIEDVSKNPKNNYTKKLLGSGFKKRRWRE